MDDPGARGRSFSPPAVSPSAVSPSAVSPSAVSPSAVSPPAVSPPTVSPPAVSPPAVSPPAVSPPAVSPLAPAGAIPMGRTVPSRGSTVPCYGSLSNAADRRARARPDLASSCQKAISVGKLAQPPGIEPPQIEHQLGRQLGAREAERWAFSGHGVIVPPARRDPPAARCNRMAPAVRRPFALRCRADELSGPGGTIRCRTLIIIP